ncbi:MAG: DUF11 domain-containing protein [Xanthomonadaceae bacterium]|nr:DUF11 domain-containing protein [Xanthomonadaceae bacterium]
MNNISGRNTSDIKRSEPLRGFRECCMRVLAWLALSLPGHALATETLDWGAVTGGGDLYGAPFVNTIGDITVTATATHSGGPWDAVPQAYRSGGAVNGVTGILWMNMDAQSGTSLPWTQMTLSFSRPVTSLSFTVLDIDGGPAHTWNDRVVVSSVPAQTPATSFVGSEVVWNAVTRTAQSASNANATDSAADIRLRFDQPITSVSVRFVAGPVNRTGGSVSQGIAIDDLSWDSGTVRVRKTTTAAAGGPFVFSQSNLLTTPGNITTTVLGTPTPATPGAHEIDAPGRPVTLTEASSPGWTLTSASCTDARRLVTGNGVTFDTLVGNTITLDAATLVLSGADITCTFTNRRNFSDVSIQKSATPMTVVSGSTVLFTLRIANLGPQSADGATIRDPPVAGLDCIAPGLAAPTCTATSGAVCPSSLTAAGLQAGVVIPTLPDGGIVHIGLACRVTATGLP